MEGIKPSSWRMLRRSRKEGPVVENGRRIRLKGGGQLVKGLRPILVTQAAMADTQLDTREIAVAVRGDEAAPAVIPGAGQGQGVPVGGLPVFFPPEEPEADLTADLRAGTVVEETAKQGPQCLLIVAQPSWQ